MGGRTGSVGDVPVDMIAALAVFLPVYKKSQESAVRDGMEEKGGHLVEQAWRQVD